MNNSIFYHTLQRGISFFMKHRNFFHFLGTLIESISPALPTQWEPYSFAISFVLINL